MEIVEEFIWESWKSLYGNRGKVDMEFEEELI
jgi:hypothetical protein